MSALDAFNALSETEARARLESCLAVPRWVDDVMTGRPYPTTGTALEQARTSALALTEGEVAAALARHPRIGERAGAGHDAELSGREQAGVDATDQALSQALALGNREYEARFDRVFLIRAAGRSAEEIVAQLQRRLGSPAETERAEVRSQLAEIALLRFADLLGDPPGATGSDGLLRPLEQTSPPARGDIPARSRGDEQDGRAAAS